MSPLALAWSNLVHKRARTLVAAAGVAFAVVLAFMELGLLGGVGRTATILFDKLEFDLLVTSSEYLDLSRPGSVSRARLAQARTAADVVPVSFGPAAWRASDGSELSLNVIAVPPDQVPRAFKIGESGVFASEADARKAGALLRRDGTFLLDRRSKPDYGTPNQPRVNGQRAEVRGAFDLGTGFSWNGMLMCAEGTFARVAFQPADECSFGLVQLKPGANALDVQRELRAALPPDVTVWTRAEISAAERRYWLRLTSVGQFLAVAVVLAVVVGVIFVYQMMAADIRNMLPEYATVKALGYRGPYLSRVVLWQALILGLFGYAPAFAVSLGLYEVAARFGGIPTQMTPEIALGVLALTCGMCLASGLLAVRKVHAADPADLF